MVERIAPEELRQEQDHLADTIMAIDQEANKIRNWSPAEAADSETANRIQENLDHRLKELDTMRPDPYFGRIDAELQHGHTPQTLYFGKIQMGDVYSWNAPVARLFYRPRDGRYMVNGEERQGTVSLKREFEITDTRIQFSDALRLAAPLGLPALPVPSTELHEEGSETAGSLLDRALGATGQRELHEVVATIQPEQYGLIAEQDVPVMIVQGAAGSGKSLIGLHRLAYLMAPTNGMTDSRRPSADRVLMLGPTVAFLDYVKNLLPGLQSQPIVQTTLRDWMFEQFTTRIRLSHENRLLRDLMSNHPRFGEREWRGERFKGSLRMRDIIDRYVRQRRRPQQSLAEEYLHMIETSSGLAANGVTASQPFTDTDLAPLLYLDLRITGRARRRYDHIVVDEAQDVSPLEVHILNMHSRNGEFTILGDLRQRLTPYRGVMNWQEMRRVFPPEQSQRFDARHSYRSTAQITRLGNRILRRLPEQGEQPLPHEREGDPPTLHRSNSVREMYAAIAERIVEGLTEAQTVAVLTRTSQDANYALRRLEEEEIDEAQALKANDVIESTLVVCPILLTKGLEFDMVLVAGVDAGSFTNTDMDKRLLYLATTRARHKLGFYWVGPPSPLIEELGAVGMEVAGNLDTSRGKRGVFDRSRPRRRGHRSRGQPRR